MSFTETYLDTSFPAGETIDVTRLLKLVQDDAAITTALDAPPCAYDGTNVTWTFVGSGPLAGAEKTALDNIVSGYDAETIPDHKTRKINELRTEAFGFVLTYFNAARQLALLMYYQMTIADGTLPNRQSHIRQAFDWSDNVIDEYISKRDSVNAATDHTGIDAVAFDFPTFLVANPVPDVTAATVVAILD